MRVELSVAAGVGAVGLAVKVGLASGAAPDTSATASCVDTHDVPLLRGTFPALPGAGMYAFTKAVLAAFVLLSDEAAEDNAHGLGRELFGGMRRTVRSAEEGAVTWC